MAETETNPKTAAKRKPRRQAAPKSGPKARQRTSAQGAQTRKAAPQETPATVFEQCAGLIADLARTNFEETMETARAVFNAKDVNAAVEIQNEYARAALTRNLEAARNLNEITTDAARETMAPYATRMAEAFDRLRTV